MRPQAVPSAEGRFDPTPAPLKSLRISAMARALGCSSTGLFASPIASIKTLTASNCDNLRAARRCARTVNCSHSPDKRPRSTATAVSSNFDEWRTRTVAAPAFDMERPNVLLHTTRAEVILPTVDIEPSQDVASNA